DDETMGRADQILTGQLFGLETTVDQQTRDAISRYQKLLGKRSRTPEEEEELRRLQETLAVRLPAPHEGPVEPRAQQLLEALLKSQVGDRHPEVQADLLERAKRLCDELQRKRP